MAIPSNLRARNVMASALRLKDHTDAVAPKDKAKWRKISGPAGVCKTHRHSHGVSDWELAVGSVQILCPYMWQLRVGRVCPGKCSKGLHVMVMRGVSGLDGHVVARPSEIFASSGLVGLFDAEAK